MPPLPARARVGRPTRSGNGGKRSEVVNRRLLVIALLVTFPFPRDARGAESLPQPPCTAPTAVDPACAPRFRLPLAAGGGEMALEDLRGRPVVIDFWATWCRPCHELLRSLDRLSRRPEFADAVFLAINVDRGDRERAADMIDDLNLHLPVLWGGTEVMSRYWVKVLPSTFLVDRRGLLRGRWAGAGDGALEDLAKELQKTLTDPADSSIQ